MIDFSQLNPLAVAMLTFAVIGAVTLYTKLIEKDWKGAGKILVAAAAGALFAPFAAREVGIHLSWFVGMLLGLNAAGVVTLGKTLGASRNVSVDQANVVTGVMNKETE